jgi:hypothetical protein
MIEYIPGSRPYTPPLEVKTAEWWEAHRLKFEALWAAGHSASQIGLALGATPGRDHAPGSPRQRAKQSGTPYSQRLAHPPRVTTPRPVRELPSLAACEPPVAALTPSPAICVPPAPQKPPAAPVAAYSPFRTCQNIPGKISEGFGLDFRVLFCAAPITTPGPYCDECRKRVYIGVARTGRPFIPNLYATPQRQSEAA